MKKTKYYAWMMAAALAMTGCSDEMEGPGDGPGTTIDGEMGYIKVALNLPTTSGTSTRANDVFDDGITAEYDVNNIIIAFPDNYIKLKFVEINLLSLPLYNHSFLNFSFLFQIPIEFL